MSAPKEHSPRFSQLIDRMTIEKLGPAEWQELRTHLSDCADCRALYNKTVLAERMLHGGPKALDAPSVAELDRIADALFADAAPASVWQRLLVWASATPRWATGLVAAAALVVLVPLVTRGPHGKMPTEDDSFQSRGAHRPVDAQLSDSGVRTERSAGVRAFCLNGSQVQALDPKGGAPPECPRGAELKLAVANPGQFARVFLVGFDAEGNAKWYAPRPPDAESVAIPVATNAGETPIGGLIRIAVNHDPGPLRIYALFSDRAVTVTEIESAAAEMLRDNRQPATGDRQPVTGDRQPATGDRQPATWGLLPLHRPDVLQRSILVEIGP